MMMMEMGDYSKEHEDWVRSEAVRAALQLHKYAPKLEEVLRDAQIIADFIFAKKPADVLPFRTVPRDGGDAA